MSQRLVHSTLAALLATVGFAAQAGELYTPRQYQDPASTLTRAQVRQSVLQARKAGALQHNDVDLPETDVVAFGATRAQVKQQVLAARANGGLEHNDVDLPGVARGSVLTRDQVRADYLASRKVQQPQPVAGRSADGRNTLEF